VLRGIMQASEPERVIDRLQAAIVAGRAAPPLPAPELPRSTYAGAAGFMHIGEAEEVSLP